MHTRWYRQLWVFLRSREGFGALLIAAFSAIALGIVPNMLQKLWDSGWLYLAVFLVATVTVVLGWILHRERGVGVIIQMFPLLPTETGRLEALLAASAKNHSSTLFIRPTLLQPDGELLAPPARTDLVANLIDARVAEQTRNGQEGNVTIYPLAQMRDGFLLGQRLADDRAKTFTVMHVSANRNTVLPSVKLATHLTSPLTPEQQALLNNCLKQPDAPVAPVAHPNCPPEHRHRLAFIVRLSRGDTMTSDARHVAETGHVRLPSGRHTGYVFDHEHPDTPTPPCGAHFIVEASTDYLPETQLTFESIATHLYRTWTVARDKWQAESGSPDIETRLFLMTPLPISMALGWLMSRTNADVAHHDFRIARQSTPISEAP
ncbi:hypothetical protein [Streptomyces sp. cg2]|uniref:hypothetical protein n=1 Tax=Streptomyces sp. cg2 TaxID=3238799 RepID=UPI0034E1B623